MTFLFEINLFCVKLGLKGKRLMDVNKLESYIDSLKRFFDEIEYYDLNEKIKITAKNEKTNGL